MNQTLSPTKRFPAIVPALALLIGALVLVGVASELLQTWATTEHAAREQGSLVRPHWVDAPTVGLVA